MADINLKRGAELAAQIIREGGDWRDLDGVINNALNRELAEEGLYAKDSTDYYRGGFELGADQADLQASEAAKFNSDAAPDPSRLAGVVRGYGETTEEGNARRIQEAVDADGSGRGFATRDLEDGSTKLRRRVLQAEQDLAYAAEARLRGESSQARYMREQGARSDRRERERKLMGRPSAAKGTYQSDDQLRTAVQAKIDSGELTGDARVQAESLVRRMKSRDPGYAKAGDFDEGRKAVQASGQRRSATEADVLAEKILRTQFDDQGTAAPTVKSMPIDARERAKAALIAQVTPRGFNQDVRLANDVAAGPNVTAQERAMLSGPVLERIGEIQATNSGEFGLGGKASYVKVIPGVDSAAFGVATPYGDIRPGEYSYPAYLGTDGNPLGIAGPQMPASRVNAPTGDVIVNAPSAPTTLMDVMERNQYSARESGTYPQVDISGTLAELDARLVKQGIVVPGGVRSMAQAEDALNQILVSGGKFNAPQSRQVVDNPGAAEALERMRYTQPEVSRVSNALIQLELAGRNNNPNTGIVNLDAKTAYGEGLASHAYEFAKQTPNPAGPLLVGPQQLSIAQRNAAMVHDTTPEFGVRGAAMNEIDSGPDLAQPDARVKPRYAALTGENIEGTPQERASALADAQRPYTGMVANEKPVGIEGRRDAPNYRYNRAGTARPVGGVRRGTAETTREGIRGAIMSDARARAAKSGKPLNMSREMRNVDNAVAVQERNDAFEAKGPATRKETPIIVEYQKRRDVARHAERPKPEQRGRSTGFIGPIQSGNMPRISQVDAQSRSNITALDEGGSPQSMRRSGTSQGGVSNFRGVRDALGATTLKDSNQPGPAASMPSEFDYSGPARRVDIDEPEIDSLAQSHYRRQELGRSKDRTENIGPRRGDNYMFRPDGVGMTEPRRANQETKHRQAVRNRGRIERGVRGGAIAAGAGLAAAGLNSLIGGERNRREEEVMYR